MNCQPAGNSLSARWPSGCGSKTMGVYRTKLNAFTVSDTEAQSPQISEQAVSDVSDVTSVPGGV